jgi:di/tricarboxylate transporter
VEQLPFIVILLVAFALLLTERLRTDVVAVLIVVALYGFRILTPEEALSGFSSEPAIVLAAIFVMSGALHQTGLSDTVGGWIGRLAGSSYGRILTVVMPSVAVLSAFTHHVTTTAVMLPIVLNIAREKGIAPSKLLMPLSFAASLGTTITIIGAPAFLIASGLLQQAGRPGLGVFDIAPIGLALSVAGTVFVLVAGRMLLPERTGGGDQNDRFRLDGYFTEISVLGRSRLVGRTVDELQSDDRHRMQVVGWLRDQREISRPWAEQPLREGDVLLVRTTPEDLLAIREQSGVELSPMAQYGESNGHASGADDGETSDQFVQAVVAPGSDLVGRTLRDVGFQRRFGAIVVGLWRQNGWLSQELSRITLRGGDVLVLHGDEDAIGRLSADPAFLMMVPFQGEPRRRQKSLLAGAIMVAAVAAAALNLMAIEMAALAGAAAMLLTGCVTPRQAYRAIDQRIFVFIAGAIPLGLAMEKTGTSLAMAAWLQGVLGGLDQTVVLLALFAVVAVLTQFMSDAATTALFAPVAIALAQALGHAPEAYVVTAAMAAVASFLTPIGHHGNLLVYGPGRYRFADFVRVGTPLTVLVALIVAFAAPLLWPPQPPG